MVNPQQAFNTRSPEELITTGQVKVPAPVSTAQATMWLSEGMADHGEAPGNSGTRTGTWNEKRQKREEQARLRERIDGWGKFPNKEYSYKHF